MAHDLLLKFRDKDSAYGVTRDTLRALAQATNTSETGVVHLALSRFAMEVLPTYEADDGPLPAAELKRIANAARKQLPKGKVLRKKTLL
ncbi:MAG: hypothetical protein ACKVQK_13565 [Burkholderiales bacterium]